MALPPKWYQFLVSVFASLGSLLFGYDLGVIAEAIAAQSFKSMFGDKPNEIGAVVSVFTGGAFFGAMFGGPAGDRFGRKMTILIGAIVFCLGGALQTGASNINFLIRGRVTALQQFMLGIGALAAAWISWGTYIGFAPTDNKQWRVSLGIQIIPGGILALLILLFPESPAGSSTTGDRVRPDPESIAIEHEQSAKSYLELFRDKSSFRRLFLACALQASVQMTGVSAIQYYSVAIYEKIGIAGDETLKYQAISSCIALFAQFLCILFVDRFGRRWPLILGNLGNMVTFIIATILLAKFPAGSPQASGSASWAFIAMTWLYNFSFSATCGPSPGSSPLRSST
ncbi:unnamed protein product [Parascedosporium putredinis]|uniref:Major facilitator superfamily (MFS) profile domain-containing protein n=1 Tax=Parascedosporium putredinis TaxID=1442378 RepID=A0A9P1MA79_9PEZI|nr:unnamed protein product [Parascedosporium putredinis]CAI7993447.1 unnamed protein product [Parascedosporium putredinis]